MARREEMMRDGEVQTKQSKFIVIELPGVVRDNNLGNSKSADDVFPYEIFGVSFCDFGEGFGLYPLGEVINGDDQEFSLQRSLG